jgi:hypothetical protein
MAEDERIHYEGWHSAKEDLSLAFGGGDDLHFS